MKQPTISSKCVRFGIYEVDLRSSELRKQGRKIKLQEQPCRILGILLEQRGEVVTREDLRKRLWSDDTFVAFDHSLNTAIMRLREALSDSSDNPVFIETLPRHGYRFIAPVEDVSASENEDQTRAASEAPLESPPSATALAGQGLMGVARDTYPHDGSSLSFVASFAEVEVDIETGAYHIVDFLAVADVGTVLHPAALGGPILGLAFIHI